ncbi:uncharacterized protein Dere_GG10945 [Drosophila erecta]|uniref:ubiquitinyl hydrolase 1 n=1 Tax=Drosophila erecta TaxID=7220 RepID=B3PAJ2_DROER|nr:uncharacterized protein Dere_GG10945 [Drosophila erecta]
MIPCVSPAQESCTVAEEAAAVEVAVMSPTPSSTCYSLQPQNQARQSNVADSKKWPCKVCTYLNWPRSLRCVQCCTKRGGETIEQRPQQPNVDTVSVNNSFNKKHIYQLGSSETINNCDTLQERQERRQRQIRRQVDWQWLNACLGVVENNYSAVEAYLSCGGNPARSLTSTEIAALNRNSAFDVGHTLIHLAIRFHREEMLPMLLAQISGSGPGIKRVPSYVAPDLAADIRRHFANTLRLRKSGLPCHYVQKRATFALPAEIEELPIPIQEQLCDAQKQLETPPPALNWSLEITARLSSRMFVLWNRSAGDCLLDSAMQATWGVFDRDNILRRALADTLHQCGHVIDLMKEEGCGNRELIPGGREVAVTSSNIFEYVRRYTEYRLIKSQEKALEALKDGVFDVLPDNSMNSLTAEDLRLLLNGVGVLLVRISCASSFGGGIPTIAICHH